MADLFPKNEDGTYVGLPDTKFPFQVDSWQDSLDVSVEMLPYVNQYRAAMESNNLPLAEQILAQHPDMARMQISATDVNEMKHGLMAVERWCAENLEESLGQYTEDAQNSAEAAARYAEAASSSADGAEASKNAAYQSEVAAKSSEDAANLLVENLRSLSGSLPSDFTEYVNDISGVREYVDSEIAAHNVNQTAHDDIRQQMTKAQMDLRILQLYHESGITTNTFSVGFEDLDDVILTKGTWDVANDRVWF